MIGVFALLASSFAAFLGRVRSPGGDASGIVAPIAVLLALDTLIALALFGGIVGAVIAGVSVVAVPLGFSWLSRRRQAG